MNLRILIAKVDFPLPIKVNIRLRWDEDKAKRASATQETNTLTRLQGEGNIVKHSREIWSILDFEVLNPNKGVVVRTRRPVSGNVVGLKYCRWLLSKVQTK